jgi:mevalonate kinase
MNKKYPAKLLLFGEYTVINNSEALAIPFNMFQGYWENYYNENSLAIESNKILSDILSYIKCFEAKRINLDGFKKDIEAGLWFNSNIPYGYGLGSSGALVAAIYDKYFEVKSKNYTDIKEDLGKIESYFHGTSSGIDPLVSYLNQSIKIEVDHSIKIIPELNVNNTAESILVFVVDCGFSRHSNNLVNSYIESCKESNFKSNYIEPMKLLTSLSIEALLNNDVKLKKYVKTISELQLLHMKKMIPDEILELWNKGIQSDLFSLKLCGAGGGGFMLGFCNDKENFDSIFKNYKTYKVMEI